jgi:NADH dehydrogenase (ubiquinone) 1 alpha subcomplex subunit 5
MYHPAIDFSLIPYRVGELENKIGAGLIEEVIQVAEGELKLVDVMFQSKA